jgi:hypothetical protein
VDQEELANLCGSLPVIEAANGNGVKRPRDSDDDDIGDEMAVNKRIK